MYWYVSIYSEMCFWPQYMYPKLIPNNGYRWCPLGKFSHLGLEQLTWPTYGTKEEFREDNNFIKGVEDYHWKLAIRKQIWLMCYLYLDAACRSWNRTDTGCSRLLTTPEFCRRRDCLSKGYWWIFEFYNLSLDIAEGGISEPSTNDHNCFQVYMV